MTEEEAMESIKRKTIKTYEETSLMIYSAEEAVMLNNPLMKAWIDGFVACRMARK